MSEFLQSAASPSGDTDCDGKHPTAHEMTCNLAQSWHCYSILVLSFPSKRFIAQTVYTVCTRINYKIVTVTNLNKYLQYGTSGTE